MLLARHALLLDDNVTDVPDPCAGYLLGGVPKKQDQNLVSKVNNLLVQNNFHDEIAECNGFVKRFLPAEAGTCISPASAAPQVNMYWL